MYATQIQPTIVWSVTTTAQQTNERAAGIIAPNFGAVANPNPIQINPYFTAAVWAVRVTAQTNLALNRVTVYAALNVNGFPPAVAAPVEDLWTYGANAGPGTVLAPNQGVMRVGMLKKNDTGGAGATDTPMIQPTFFLLEYTTGAPGATPSLTFVVEVSIYCGEYPDLNE